MPDILIDEQHILSIGVWKGMYTELNMAVQNGKRSCFSSRGCLQQNY